MTEAPRVLLGEDEYAQREVLAYNLEAEGFDVIQADNGEDALLLVDEDQPDMIILDWMMPKLSGIEVCRQLKMRPETRSIPVLMLSARAEEVDKIRGLETGADDYVVKPFSARELLARVEAAVLQRAQRGLDRRFVGHIQPVTRPRQPRDRPPPRDKRVAQRRPDPARRSHNQSPHIRTSDRAK